MKEPAKLAALKQQLAHLRYDQPLGVETAPLVESLLADLMASQARQAELTSLAEKRADELSVAEQHVLPVRKENQRLVRENNEVRTPATTIRRRRSPSSPYIFSCGPLCQREHAAPFARRCSLALDFGFLPLLFQLHAQLIADAEAAARYMAPLQTSLESLRVLPHAARPPASSPELTRSTPPSRLLLCAHPPQLTRSACRGSRVAAKTECGLALHHVPAAVEARRTAAGERRAARPLPRVARAEWHRPAVGPRGKPRGAPARPSCPLCDRPIPMRYARPSAGRTSLNRP